MARSSLVKGLAGTQTIPIEEFNDTLGKVIFLGWYGVEARSGQSSGWKSYMSYQLYNKKLICTIMYCPAYVTIFTMQAIQ